MLSVPVRVPECPDPLLALLFMNGVVAQYWSIIPGGIYQVLHEPITGVDSFDVFGMEECSSADWNLKGTRALGAFAHYTHRNSQHCPVMILNSKQ